MKLIPTMLKVASIITILFFATGAQAAIVTTGDINPANPATWTNATAGIVGNSADGSMQITGGSSVSSDSGTWGYNSGVTGGVIVTGTGTNWTNVHDFIIGRSGTGTLSLLENGAVSNANSTIGWLAGSTGTVTVNNGSWTNSAGLTVGMQGTGVLNIIGGGTVSSTDGRVGGYTSTAHGVGTVTVSGSDSVWTNTNSLTVGDYGTGTLNIENGGVVSSAGGLLAHGNSGSGTVVVTGAGSRWASSNRIYVGSEGSGTLTIENGGTITSTYVQIGHLGTGEATITGMGSTWTSSASFNVGYEGTGTGTLTITDGGLLSNVDGNIGYTNGSTGNVTVNHGTWTNSGNLNVGYDGSGTLTIENGGTVSSASAVIGLVGSLVGSSGTATVTGAGSGWIITNDLVIGGSVSGGIGYTYGPGDGTLNILAGGVVNNTNSYIGSDHDSSDRDAIGTVTVDGSGSTWTHSGNLTVGRNGTGTLNVTNGGSVSSENGLIGESSTSTGTVTVTGTGSTWNNSSTLTIGAAGSGTLNISTGGEVLAASADIGSTGLLSGDSTLTLGSGGILTNSGTIAPGNSIGTLTVNGDVVFENGSTFEMEIDNAGNSDKLDVTGDVTINTGSTVAINSNGETITDGKEYTLIEAGGSITGEFTTLDTALVTWDAAVTSYEMAYDTTTAALVVGVPVVAPFDTPTLLITKNQLACGGAVEQISNDGGTLGGITAALQGIVGDDEFRYAYDQLSGQTRPSIAPMADAGVSSFANAILTRGHNSQSVEIGTNDHDYYFWVKGFGNFGDRDSKDGVNGSDYDIVGVATGLDYQVNTDFRAGISLGLSDTDVEYDDTRDSSRIDSFYSALYGTYRGFDGYIDALLTYAYLDNETDRYVDFVSEKNEGNFDGYELLATVEAAKNYSFKNILIQPLLGFELSYQRQDGYTETGGSSALRYDDQSFESYKGSLGVNASKYFYKNNQQSLWGHLQAKWTHEFGATAADIDVSFASTPGYRFTIKDAEMGRDSAILGAGLKYAPRNNTLFFVDYDAQVNNDTLNHIISGGIRLAF